MPSAAGNNQLRVACQSCDFISIKFLWFSFSD